MEDTCKLCLRESIALCNSHIIPEFNYKPCYDDRHRFFQLSTIGRKNKSFKQKGFREYLLCQDCETKLSRWEGYAKKVLMDGGLDSAQRHKWGYEFHGVDYSQFKLYLLSILWRMGVSSLDIFETVKLEHHQERIRLALMNEDPLDEHLYPVLFVGVTLSDRFITDFIVPPSSVEMDGGQSYRCLISGILYTFCVSSQRLPEDMEPFAIHRDGILNLPMMPIEHIPFLYDHFCQIHKAINKKPNKAEMATPRKPAD